MRRTIQRVAAATGTAIVVLTASAAGASAATIVTKYSPFDADGALRHGLHATPAFGGACVTGSFAVPGDGVYRCFERDVIRDPCYLDEVQSDPERSVVVCVETPWAGTAIRLRVRDHLGSASAARPGGAPWAVRLASRSRCVWIEGVTALVHGRRISYRCANGRWLLGSPDRREATWRISEITGPTDHTARRVAIAEVWR